VRIGNQPRKARILDFGRADQRVLGGVLFRLKNEISHPDKHRKRENRKKNRNAVSAENTEPLDKL